MPTFLVGEITFYTMALAALLHAFANGGIHILAFAVSLIGNEYFIRRYRHLSSLHWVYQHFAPAVWPIPTYHLYLSLVYKMPTHRASKFLLTWSILFMIFSKDMFIHQVW